MRAGEIGVNTSRIVGLDATNADDLTKAEIEGRRQVMMLTNFFREKVPGFANCYLIVTPTQVGVRETRRIIGEYSFDRRRRDAGAPISGQYRPQCVSH